MKKILSSMLCALTLCVSFLFVGCGESFSYTDVKTNYGNMKANFEGSLFNNGTLDFNYNTELQNLIDTSSSDGQITKLSSDLSSGQAIFEPVLRAGFESCEYYLSLEVDSKEVPQDKTNLLQTKLDKLEQTLTNLNNSKIRLEEIAASNGNVKNWLQNYFDRFYEAICASNDFALEYIDVYGEFLNFVPDVKDRLLPSVVQLDFAKKLAQSANIYTTFTLSQIKNEVVNASQNNVNVMLANFLDVKDILKSSAFIGILSNNLTEKEQEMLKAYSLVSGYNSLYENNFRETMIGVNTFGLERLITESSEKPLSESEQVCLKKVNEFLNTDQVLITNYLVNLKDKIKLWNE